MAMTRIRVALLPSAVCIAGTDPTLKIKDQQTGEVATDRETGASLYTVTVMLMEDGRAEVLKITVPETGLAAGLKPGAMVGPSSCSRPRGRGSSTVSSPTASPTGPPAWSW
ncbi:hypothetical protein [Streptomyces subrutilus]|uniref:hypothetical protein n=1 Tax=Streptomyces subrutilus TaxID=36818 RepID=UPI003990756A|nr:hypothetical protein OG479_21850 [Streptomyces subrutilus]